MRNKQPAAGLPPTFYDRWSRVIIVCTLLCVPLAFYSAGKAVQSNVNKVEDWLPKSFVETSQLHWFRQYFISDQVVIVSWEGCQLSADASAAGPDADDPRIERLAQLLVPHEQPLGPARDLPTLPPETEAAAKKYFKSVMTGRRLLERMLAPPLSIDREEAYRRLQGTGIGADGRQTCVVVSLQHGAVRELRKILATEQKRVFRPNCPAGALRQIIAAAGIPDEQVHLGGPPVDNVAIDEEGERTLVRLAGFSALLGLGLAWWSLRSVLLTGIVFATGVFSAATSLGIVWLTGQNLDAILMSMPSLVYVLAISGAVHLVNYYRTAIAEGGLHGAAERAVTHAWKPALLCSITTAIGLVSLYASELVPIQKFGVYSAVGVMSLLGILFLFLPAALHATQIGRRWVRDEKRALAHESDASLAPATGAERMWEWLAKRIVGNHGLVTAACLLVIATVGYGLTRTKTSINLLDLFDGQARILHDYAWLEQKLGMLVPLEVVLRFDADSQLNEATDSGGDREDLFRLTFLERMETVAAAQELIEQRFGPEGSGIVGRTMSAVSFAPPLPAVSGNTVSFVHRKALNMRLASSRREFIDSGFYRVVPEDGTELWRISLRVAAFKGVDYGTLVGELNRLINPVVDAHRHRLRILKQLATWNSEGNYAGARVLVWSRGSLRDQSSSSASPDSATSELGTISSLLTKARCKVFHGEVDPAITPLVQLEKLGALDGVVMVGDFSDADVSTVRSIVPHTIDARPIGRSVSTSQKWRVKPDSWVTAVYTGVVPIVYKAQRALLESLIQSTFWSFLTITPLMMLVSRSVLAGAVAMIPNVLPVLFIFGGMGWLGISIDIGSMMSASIALGVAVDDTIHFLSWYRDDLNRLRDRRLAIVAAYRRCATPTLQAALISGLGLSVFALSTFTPTQRFGWLMLTILIAGVVSELIMLPALLAGPLGRVFKPSAPTGHGNASAMEAIKAAGKRWRQWYEDEPPMSESSSTKAA